MLIYYEMISKRKRILTTISHLKWHNERVQWKRYRTLIKIWYIKQHTAYNVCCYVIVNQFFFSFMKFNHRNALLSYY